MFEIAWAKLQSHEILQNLLASSVYFLILYIIRRFSLQSVRAWNFHSNDTRRRWLVSLQNFFFLALVIGLIVIWATELRALALSLAAIAVALVLAIKELLLCISGGLLRTSSRAFGIGDRIEISGLRGDVIDENLFVTTILEVGPGVQSHQYTGRSVTFPNSLLLTAPVVNETYTDQYVLHPFKIPFLVTEDWRSAEKSLLAIANDECRPFLEEAQRHFDYVARTRGLETPSAEPRITLHFPDPNRIDLLMRIPAPARRKGRLEQAILRRYLAERNALQSPSAR